MKPLTALLLASVVVAPASARPWSDDVIYFAITDRFYDGDTSNNTPAGCDPALHDPAQLDINRYHGGDLRGLERALRSGYFNELGITALWITSCENSWRSGFDLGGWKTGYHGYWAQDFLDIDPHLTSSKSLDGKPYPDTREGRMQHYRDFIKLAHSKGIKVVQDVVINHLGPLFYYDTNENGVFEQEREDEWVRPFQRDGYYPTAQWADIPKWNLTKAGPQGPIELFGRTIPTSGVLADLEVYSRKGFNWDSLGANDGQEMMCDFFSLRDLWTAPGSATFDRLVDEFVEIYQFYLVDMGVDGLRVDTVKHVHHEFWDAWTSKLRARIGEKAAEKLIFGEVFDGNPARLGQYTYRADWPKNQSPSLDSVLNFRYCFTARDYLRKTGETYGTAHQLEKAIHELRGNDDKGRPWYNLSPGGDGKNAADKSITFIENHDGINRFRCKDVSERRHMLAQALVLLSEGIPCIYYGAEIALQDTKGEVGQDTETGRITLFPRANKGAVGEAKTHPAFGQMNKLIRERNACEILRHGDMMPLWSDSGDGSEDDGVFAFLRQHNEAFCVVVMNLSKKPACTGAGEHAIRLLRNGEELASVGTVFEGKVVLGEGQVDNVKVEQAAGLRFSCPAESVVIYRPIPLPKNE